MSSVKEYATTAMLMQCDQGAMPMPFKATPKLFQINGLDIGNELDIIPIVNIPSFGFCQALTKQANGVPVPCIPVVAQWQKVDTVKRDGAKILLKKSCISCLSGNGKIEFK
jgi:Domain of unknown function (DUF4280)